MTRPCVYLLRGTSSISGEDDDPYQSTLLAAGYESCVIPVLQFESLRLKELNHAMRSTSSRYRGIVLTSKRSVEAMLTAMELSHGREAIYTPGNTNVMPVFVVGEATEHALMKERHRVPFAFECLGASECGNAVPLSALIIRHFTAEAEARSEGDPDGDEPVKLLFPCGNLHMNVLEDTLAQHNMRSDCPIRIELDTQIVYETKAVDKIEVPQNCQKPTWIAFFSPSGVQSALPMLENENAGWRCAKMAAIGNTTAKALQQVGLTVNAVAAMPTAQDIVEAIRLADKTNNPQT